MQPRLDRADRPIEFSRQFLPREPLVIGKQNAAPVLGIERGKAPAQRLSIGKIRPAWSSFSSAAGRGSAFRRIWSIAELRAIAAIHDTGRATDGS
jgi:hypothetical protein